MINARKPCHFSVQYESYLTSTDTTQGTQSVSVDIHPYSKISNNNTAHCHSIPGICFARSFAYFSATVADRPAALALLAIAPRTQFGSKGKGTI